MNLKRYFWGKKAPKNGQNTAKSQNFAFFQEFSSHKKCNITETNESLPQLLYGVRPNKQWSVTVPSAAY